MVIWVQQVLSHGNIHCPVPYWYCDLKIYIYNTIHKEEYYICIFQQVVHIFERDLTLIFLTFTNKALNRNCSTQVCAHRLGLLRKISSIEQRGSSEIHTVSKITAYEQHTDATQKPDVPSFSARWPDGFSRC